MIAGKYTNGLVFGNKPEDIEGYEDAITSDEMYVPHHVLEYKYTIDELVSLNRYDKVSADELIWMPQSVHNLNATLHKGVRSRNDAMKGKHLSDETKRKMSDAKKGSVPWNKNKTLSDETKRKMSEALKGRTSPNKGRTFSEEHRRKMREAWVRRKAAKKNISEETRRKMSVSLKGRTSPMKGKKMSEESRKKMSEARKAYLRTRNQQV